MGQAKPFRAIALIVEDDPAQREMICLLLEESDYDVIQCESAEAAEMVLERNGGALIALTTLRGLRRRGAIVGLGPRRRSSASGGAVG